ncbi:hypothetical protein GLOIN_2v1792200 [Rhizophagus irregularis DAOM 181602=DAOM 197198]|nr:hypothetical protein GLOIN_2v1792200 [Rhizophagus irregularis DAOM 181602=DAOM 197198]
MFLKKIRADKKQHKKSNFRLRKSRDTHSNNNSSISNHTIILDKQQNICENNTSSQSNMNNFYYKINESINNNHDTSKNNKDSYHNFNDFNEDLIDDDFTENCDTNGEFNGREYNNNKKQNCYSGDAGPYFPNFTIFLLFLWVIKHQIGFEAYKDFANIVKHPKFNANDVPFSLATVKKYRNGLPLLPFKGYTISLNNHNTPSTSKPTTQAFIFPLKNILCRILSNPQLHEHIIENIVEYNSLPFQFKSQQRRNASYDGCLWMTDYTIIINPINIVSKVDIWLTDIGELSNFQYFINEIVYCINGQWSTRPIDLRHHHPVEYITTQNTPSNLPIYKFFLDIYIDKFGPFRNAYHGIGGIYLQIGNMPQILRQKLKNHFLIGFIPFSASCDEVLQPLINDIQDLEHGYELEISNQTVWVTGGLGVITSDLPEGNEQSGIKNHNAHYGCRNCMIHHNNLHNITFDIVKYARYHHITTSHFEDISNAKTQAEREILSTQYGIREKPSSFDSISRDKHIQCPHDAFHCIGGLAKEMLQSTFGILNSIGENEFLNVWRNFEYPSVWSRQQNPISHLNSYFFSDYLRLSMIMPFLINRSLISTSMLNRTIVEFLIEESKFTKRQIIDQFLSLWASFSKMASLIFCKEFSEDNYNDLQQNIIHWSEKVGKFFPRITQLPNFHILCHFTMHARNFATLVNVAVPTKEMMHRLFKAMIPHSNKKNIEMDFVQCDNCLQTLRFLLDGGVDKRYDTERQLNFNMLSKDQCVRALLSSWYILPSKFDLEQDDDNTSLQITCMDENYINIKVQGLYTKHDLQTNNLEKNLDNNLFAEFGRSYNEELDCTEHLTSRKVKYYKSISYTIVDGNNQSNIRLRVGDVINVLEDISDDRETELKTITSYAQIRAIFLHTKDQLQIPFLLLNWFISLGINDSKLGCPRYRLQQLSDQTWRRIYAIKWIDHQPNNHFIHQCRKTVCLRNGLQENGFSELMDARKWILGSFKIKWTWFDARTGLKA